MMSDSDDSDILADIQALDRVLTTTSQENVQYPSSSKVQFDNVYSTEIDSDVESDNFSNFVKENCDANINSLNAFEINMKLITGLTIVKNKFSVMLRQCEEKIKQLDQELENSSKESNRCSKLPISHAGMPYFKDKDYFYVPKNSDTILKEARGELFVVYMQKPSRWSDKDRQTLLRAVHNEAFESVLSRGFDKQVDSRKSKRKENNQAEEAKLVLPRNFNEMVGALGEREFDWLKISNVDFDNKHSAGECRAMWNVYLHPDIRKTEWTAAEDKKLIKYAKLCKYQDWDTITQKLGTNRSAYQCFIRYNTIKAVPSSGLTWTKQEDKHLLRVIETLRVGNYIPWFEVANYLRHRTKQQIYTRWIYRTAPHLKKGRFTLAETQQLFCAIKKYGKDFRKIAHVVMPNRTSSQLINRYNTIITKANGRNLWTAETDMQLIQLHKKHGNNWSYIAKYFSGKTRTQVRHRFNAILKYVQRGISIDNIPRASAPKKVRYKKSEHSTMSEYNKKILMEKLLEKAKHRTVDTNDIEPRLYETLVFPPSSESATQEEPYNFKLLARETRKLYNTLELLGAKLDIPMDFLNYMHLNKRDKELVTSLKEYINIKNNKTQNSNVIEEFRTRMFGPELTVDETSRFIPPLPFNGYVRQTKKVRKKDKVIDCNLGDDKHLITDVPVEFFPCTLSLSFLSFEERIQFDKFSQFFANDYHEKRNVNLHKSLQCNSSFDGSRSSLSRRSKSNTNSKVSSRSCTQVQQSDNLEETISTEYDENEENTWDNIILPNNATLLGWKNLLVWKLLYECENEFDASDESNELSSEKQSEERAESEDECESAEYQLLRTRLLKLFKFPVGLSNTILEITKPDIFLTNEEQHPVHENTSRKRKFVKRVSKRKKVKNNDVF
ncbi:snRNA-activating protein complex subunit 4 [Linepithema humile]|uniref:snRNA-activating protein complex subunit 4 n=1 Tax=Linepithema humile TaxID=83485 RepID=UPI000623156B|nr:PREDICTED: snRNA-activating protein complex subunit 4 isoform X1 [Linepithema humile]XP_012221861.1 PREDICTED: snRNA-activating protein complex subunit 4 isoform X2 [Linepithema humile]